jgi:UDP-GlcNAc:undecaprenyl-phosphate GlcNAc-1-phosphate transferase
MNSYLTVFITALLSSFLLTRMVRDWAKRRGWLDHPDSVRKLHTEPIPQGGGIAILLSMLVGLAVLALLQTNVGVLFRQNLLNIIPIIGLGGLMMLVGLWDDAKSISAWKKFSGQIVVAIIAWAAGFRILVGWSHHGELISLGILSLPLTVLWIVGITNAFNLIDGIDGLSAGAALFAMVSLLVFSIVGEMVIPIILLSALAGATLGFLRFNFNPASIYLGDSGSLFLGFMLALLSISGSQKSTTAFAIAVPVVAFGLPVLDTAVTIVRRFVSGTPIFSGDRRHIHHVLIEKGLKPRNAVILLYGVCGMFGLVSLLFLNPTGKTIGFGLAVLGACMWFGIQQLHYPELRELNAHFARGIQNQRGLIAGSVVVGRLIIDFRRAVQPGPLWDNLAAGLAELEFSGFVLKTQWPQIEAGLPTGTGWKVTRDGSGEVVLSWCSPNPGSPDSVRGRLFQYSAQKKSDADFVIQFPMHLPAHKDSSKRTQRVPAGTISFYHPLTREYPTPAICLLSQNVWAEFENALVRIMGRSVVLEERRSRVV